MHPTLGTEEAPLAHARASDEQRPAMTVRQFVPMRGLWHAQDRHPGAPQLAALRRYLVVAPLDDDRQIDPRMVVQSPVVIVANDLVKINVKPRIAGNHPPSKDVGILCAADDEVGRARPSPRSFRCRSAHFTARSACYQNFEMKCHATHPIRAITPTLIAMTTTIAPTPRPAAVLYLTFHLL